MSKIPQSFVRPPSDNKALEKVQNADSMPQGAASSATNGPVLAADQQITEGQKSSSESLEGMQNPNPVKDNMVNEQLVVEQDTGRVVGTEDSEKIKHDQEQQDAIERDAKAFADAQEQSDTKDDEPEPEFVNYTSFPIMQFRVGQFQFDKGLLTVTPAEAVVLDQLLRDSHASVKSSVKKINTGGAEKLAKEFINNGGKMTRGPDTAGFAPETAGLLFTHDDFVHDDFPSGDLDA